MEAAFVNSGKQEGIEVWRIEKLAPVKQANFTGKLHSGDSYIFLKTSLRSNALSWAVHFWLGSETSQDESGIAAYKSVELDDYLGGAPVQYREVQGSESELFLSYFKSSGGIEYLPGGMESGFVHVERDTYETRLLQCKGSRTVRVTPVPVSKSSLTSGDVFILDAGLQIFIFNGKTASKSEKVKGVEVASCINNDSRGGRAIITRIEDDSKNETFWSALGGYVDPSTLPVGESDDVVKDSLKSLFRVSDASGKIEFTEETLDGGKLTKSKLDSNDVFIIDVKSKIYIWIGKGCNLTEKKEAMPKAIAYIAQKGLPAKTQIERVSEGYETSTFKAEFAVWDAPRSFAPTKQSAPSTDVPVNIAELLKLKEADDTPIDDGSGKLEVWVVSDFKLKPVDPATYGQFYCGDSYVVLYTYLKNKKEEYVLYFWLGNDSTADEKGAAALLTKEMDDARGGRPVQVRVTQGKEPVHFRTIFKGKMIIHAGGAASGFKNKADSDSHDTDGKGLFHIKGTNALNTYALQVPEKSTSLNSEDVFVLCTPATVFVWKSLYASKDEVTMGLNVAATLAGNYQGSGGRSIEELSEGAETEEFWANLGGNQGYDAIPVGEQPPREARLFELSTATGSFKATEIFNFDQADLNDEDVYLLDTYTTVFVWVGSQSSSTEKRKSTEFAMQYVTEANDGRDSDTAIIAINAGNEPSMFTYYFRGWSNDFAEKNKHIDPYALKVAALKAEQDKKRDALAPADAVTNVTVPSPVKAAAPFFSTGTYSLDELRAGVPAGVNPAEKEASLDNETFQSLFNMSRADFSALAKWKRDAEKKKVGLF